MQKTTNYGLTKPEVGEFYNVLEENANKDIIDAKLKEIEELADGQTVQNIINGTTPAGKAKDSEKLGGKSASEYALQSTVDNIHILTNARIHSAGWYRIAKYENANVAILEGQQGNSCNLILKAIYGYDTAIYRVQVDSVYKKQNMYFNTLLASAINTLRKIRYTIDNTNGVAYLEVYSDYVGTQFSVELTHPTDHNGKWKVITPTLTEETVDGVTVTTTYDIPANVKPATTADLANYMPVDGSRSTLNQVSDLNNFLTGIGLFSGEIINTPDADFWLIVAGGLHGTVVQLAIDLWNIKPMKMRYCGAGEWSIWIDANVGLANYLPLNAGVTSYVNGDVRFNAGVTIAGGMGGMEGGQFELAQPENTDFESPIVVDIFENTFRIFAQISGETRIFVLPFHDMIAGHNIAIHSGNVAQHALTPTTAFIKEYLNVTSDSSDSAFTSLIQYMNETYLRNKVDDINYADIRFGTNKQIKFQGATNGVAYDYNIHHDGNSNKIVFTADSTTAPAADALWAHL